jgi:hypothetical protein
MLNRQALVVSVSNSVLDYPITRNTDNRQSYILGE